MNRRLWGTVAVVLLVLAGVSWAAGATGGLEPAVAWWSGATTRVMAWLAANGPALEAALGALALPTAAAALAVALGVGGWRRHRGRRRAASGHAEPWRTVIEMGRKGGHPAAIARATGLAQDAVRIMLAPIAPDETVTRGNSFRTTSPGPGLVPRPLDPRA